MATIIAPCSRRTALISGKLPASASASGSGVARPSQILRLGFQLHSFLPTLLRPATQRSQLDVSLVATHLGCDALMAVGLPPSPCPNACCQWRSRSERAAPKALYERAPNCEPREAEDQPTRALTVWAGHTTPSALADSRSLPPQCDARSLRLLAQPRGCESLKPCWSAAGPTSCLTLESPPPPPTPPPLRVPHDKPRRQALAPCLYCNSIRLLTRRAEASTPHTLTSHMDAHACAM